MRALARKLLAELDAAPRADLVLRLTLVALLLSGLGRAWSRPLFALAAAAGLLLASLRASALFWGALFALAAWRVASAFPLGDNHAFLLAYWLLAILLATLARDADAVLAWNGRALIGLVFAFATLWKLISPDFLDGRFFLVTLVDDQRLESFTHLAAGLDWDQLDALRALVREHQDGLRVPQPDDPAVPARLISLAQLLSVSLLALEASVAVCSSRRTGRGSRAPATCCCSSSAPAPTRWRRFEASAAAALHGRGACDRIADSAGAPISPSLHGSAGGARLPWLRALAD